MNAVMNPVVDISAVSDALTRVHIRLMSHPETRLYASVILLGKSEVVDTPDCPTAYTDGINKKYGAAFCSQLSLAEMGGLVLHENIHVMLKHLPRHRDLMKEDAELANIAMDYVTNLLIDEVKDKTIAVLPEGGLLDRQYKGWSVREVYEHLRREEQKKDGQEQAEAGTPGKPGGGNGRPQPLDKHDFSKLAEATPEEVKKIADAVDSCLHQAGILAGRTGAEIPRAMQEVMAPEVDWLNETREFVSAHAWGRDEATWRRYNRRYVADDIFLPSTYSETIDELVVACDLSGSVHGEVERKLLSEVANVAMICKPKRLRVLWWDTEVRSEQVFEEDYAQVAGLLRPVGGGGTRVGSVSGYIRDKNIKANCLVVLTDGHVEYDVKWEVNTPTLWLITANNSFVPPGGGVKVRVNS